MIIRKYKNRKFYSPSTHGYITLKDIVNYINKGNVEFQIVDHSNGKDITLEVLSKLYGTLVESVYVKMTVIEVINAIKSFGEESNIDSIKSGEMIISDTLQSDTLQSDNLQSETIQKE